MSGFKLNLADLDFILRQIKVAEANAAGTPLTEIYVDAAGNVVSANTPGAVLAIPDPHVPVGLRTVDGTNNNIVPGRETWGASDQPMPRLLDPNYTTGTGTIDLNGPNVSGGDVTGGNYANGGTVVDTAPRTVSNLIVDVTLNNPAAIIAALTFAGSTNVLADQGLITTAWEALKLAQDTRAPNIATLQTTLDNLLTAKGVSVTNGSIDVPNVAPDEGLSAPFNAWMTFFGQFFDHGLDLISKGSNGTVYVPLAADDPLVTHGPDGIKNTGDEVPASLRFMALTRATPDEGSQTNTTTPFVDQNQTYTSHASHQVFLREYAMVGGKPVATGKLLGGDTGGLATWADVKEQARDKLGIVLSDLDVLNVPLLRTDAYGEFIRDTNGFPQVIVGVGNDGVPNTADDVIATRPANGPLVLANIASGYARTSHAFLDDIAHNAAPALGLAADGDTLVGNAVAINPQTGQRLAYDNELLDEHFITGDGRGNENIGLSTVHHIFHSEHNRQVDSQKLTILQSGDINFVNEWFSSDITATQLSSFLAGYDAATNKATFLSGAGSPVFNSTGWDGERLFQAARFATEMQYQHLVFEEFARKIQPAIDVFVFNSATDINPAIFSEFANTVYRFGHSMLTENMPRIDGNGNAMDNDLGLVESFLNPVLFDSGLVDHDNNPNTAKVLRTFTHDEGAAAIVRGMTIERGAEIDEFVVDALRNNLLGLPLDLAALNIARGRDTGMPSLNDARTQLYAASGSTFLKPYTSWADLASNLKNPASIVNFIAAYGTHTSITGATTLDAKRDAAWELVFGTDVNGGGVPADRLAFLNSTGTWTAGNSGLNNIDLWIGGLAEKKMPFGGMLGSTFNAIFELQLENLQDGDRFYYLTRTQGQNFLTMLEQNSFAKMIMANTDLAKPGADGIRGTADDVIERHIGVDSFAAYDYVLEVNVANQADYDPTNASVSDKDPTGNDPVLEAMGQSKVLRDDPGTPGIDLNFLRFFGGEHIVAGGTNGNDTIITDFGDDGIWGDAGNDRIESGAGVDLVNGGAGNDIITDSGDTGDFLKGDEGDDVIANSNGVDILMGGTGKDVVFVGVDSTEVFGGEGDDFIAGGDGVDFLLGGEGNDWMEAAGGFDTTAGDNSELFFNSAIKGHDVMFAGTDEHDFDAESGDDIMVQGESVVRNEGMFGFDWAIYKGVSVAADADLRVPIFTTEQADVLRNRFDKTEALSGWDKNDILRGDDRVADPSGGPAITVANEGVFFNDELTQAGVDRITGLRAMLGNLVATAPANATAAQLEALVAFNAGNILLGGGGSDLLQGNGGDDYIDGDNWLNVRIRISTPGSSDDQLTTIDSLRHVFTMAQVDKMKVGVSDPVLKAEWDTWVGKSLFELLLDRAIVPAQLHIVREIVNTGARSTDVDTAVFNDRYENDDGTFNYTITRNSDGTVTVTHVTVTAGTIDPITGRAIVSDGVDTLRNIERLQFTDQTIEFAPPKLYLQTAGQYADNFNTASFGNSTGTTNWSPDWVESNDSDGVTGGQIQIDGGNGQGTNELRFAGGSASNGAQIQRSLDLTGATAATLSYSVDESGLDGGANGETVRVLFSRNAALGESSFVEVDLIRDTTGQTNRTIDLTQFGLGPFTANAAIRFVASAISGTNEDVRIDNLAINFAMAPVVNFETTFTEDQADQNIASNPLIVENDRIVSARVVLTNAQAGDSFDIPNNLPGNINSSVATVGGQLVVTLSGSEPSIALWQAAIQAIQFTNNSENPSTLDRIIEVTVNDGSLNSNVATTTVNVVSVDDPTNANNDTVITNVARGVAIVIPEWALLANDSDPDNTLDVSSVGGANGLTNPSLLTNPGSVTVTDPTNGNSGGSFSYTATGGNSVNATVTITNASGTVNGTNGDNILIGNDAASALNGNDGNDIIIAGRGNDTINGGDENDTIVWNSNSFGQNDGRDLVNGAANTDTFMLNGNADAETFGIYTRAAWLAVAGNTATQINGATEIVVTRNGTNNAAIIAELDSIEEIVVNGSTASPPGGPVNANNVGGDTIQVFGDFTQTSLALNTITVNGGTGNDTVDFSALSSAHRIVFRSNGGNDTIVGTIRPQDVVELANGQDIADYVLTPNGNGTSTLSNGTHTITFAGAVPPQFQNASPPPANGDGISGAFEYTPSDLAGLKALINGQQPNNGDDGLPTGVRELSGHGNNIANPNWGSADQPFIRITDPHYGAAGTNGNLAVNPVFAGLDPRTISDVLGAQEAGLPLAGNDANIFFMAMGQYIDHGLDFLGKGGNGSIVIGAPGGGAPGSGDPADLTRGTVAGYANGVPQHINRTSPYIDQNQAYGSNELVGQFLREAAGNGAIGSHLFAGQPDPSNPNFSLLPTLRELIVQHWDNNTVFHSATLPGGSVAFRDYFPGLVANNVINATMLPTMISNFMGTNHALLLDANPFINVLDHYIAGDGRANENFALTSIHTIWARNHNYHVEGLEAAGFQGTAEELFQAAKMINEAEYQRVVFDEYLDTLLGGLRSEGTHGFKDYDPTANAGISHEFAGAVFRFGHSLIGQTMTVLDEDGNPTQVNLFDAFLNPSNAMSVFNGPLPPGYVPQPGYAQHGVNAIIGGTISQPSEDVDFNIVDAVRNDLVRINADLFAFNVARGWDLGIGTLNQVRSDLSASTNPYVAEAVGFAGGNLTPYSSWEDFQLRNGLSDAVIAQFRQAYPDLVLAAGDIAAFSLINPDIAIAMQSNGTGIVSGIDRVDLWVGGLAERHINDGLVGETFWVVLSEQFERLQDGDRFYYIDRFDNFDFYENFIDGQQFADVIARNTGITTLPERVFETDPVDDGAGNGGDNGGTTDPGTGGGDGTTDPDTGNGNGGDVDDEEDDEDDDVDQDDDDIDDEDDADDEDDTDTDSDDDGPVVVPPATSNIVGTIADDVLIGTSNGDLIFGMAGSDAIIAGGAADIIKAGAGEDFIDAGDGRDVIFAGADADEVFAGGDDDLVYGDDGDDRIFAGDGNDMATAGKGNDTVFGDAGNDKFVAEIGDGDDVYHGDGQNGGTGIDTLDMSAATAAVTVNLGTGLMNHGSAISSQTGNDTLWGIENAVTGSGADTIIASAAVNVMDGGAGADIFRFHTIEAADGDTIVGFEPGDRIDFTNIDADMNTAGNQAFQLINGNSTNAATQLVVLHETRTDGDYTVVRGDVDGDTADFQVNIKGHHTLNSGDFSL